MRPIVLAAIAYVTGCVMGALVGADGATVCAVAAALAAPIAVAKAARTRPPSVGPVQPASPSRPLAMAALLAVFCVAGAFASSATSVGYEATCAALATDGQLVEVIGTLEALPGRNGATPVRIDRAVIDGRVRECGGPARVRLPVDVQPDAGKPVRIVGRWWATVHSTPWPVPPERRGVLVADEVDDGRAIDPDQTPTARWRPWLLVRVRLQASTRQLFGPRSGLVEALMLARREQISPAIRARFVEAGLAHLLAISGTHVALIAGALFMMGGALRMDPRTRAWCAGGGTAGYVAFIGAPHAATRAAAQIALLLIARMTQRPADPFALLSAAAILVTWVDPLAPIGPGFQLSFAGILGIMVARGPLLACLPRRWARWLRDGLATGIAATIATAPIAALHFGQFAPIGIVATLAAMPLLALAVPAIAVSLLSAAMLPELGSFLADGTGLVLDLLVYVADRAAAVPGGHAYVTTPTVLTTLAACAAAIVMAAWVRARGEASRATARGVPRSASRGVTPPGYRDDGFAPARPRAASLAAAGSATIVFLLAPVAAALAMGAALEIHAIDVGQGDAIAIRSPRGRWILVDAGPRTDSYDAGRSQVVPFLSDHGARRIEALILTHPHADHIGGAAAILEMLDVARVIDPAVPVGGDQYLETLSAARHAGVHWQVARAGREMRIDGMTLEFLAPDTISLDDLEDPNDYSVVFRLEYGTFAAIFFGDAPAEVENRIIARYGTEMTGQLIKVGHHGSRTSTGDSLLNAVRPMYALITVGSRNRYGHPNPGVVDRLRRYGIGVLRTDERGDIRVRVGPTGRVELAAQR